MTESSKPAPAPSERLRAAGGPPFHVVLVQPEIPPNTGNVGRLCAATGARLHLVEPLGFRIDEHAVRRAGLDYWPLIDLRVHANYAAARDVLIAGQPSGRRWLLSGKARQSYLDVAFRPGDALIFGRESTGLDDALLQQHEADAIGIPMPGKVRSLNLANAVAIVLYEALRQVGHLQKASVSY